MTHMIKLNYRHIKNLGIRTKISREMVHYYVDIDENLLVEKDSWYFIDSKAHFFKERNDARLAGECLSQKFAEELGEECAKYYIVKLNNQIGLLTENFQDRSKYEYYDYCELHKLLPAFPKQYNTFSLKKMLMLLEMDKTSQYGDVIVAQIIKRYVFAWYTHQLDSNVRNNNCRRNKNTKVLEVGPLFDCERSFGINRNGEFDESVLKIWVPAIPYDDLSFKDSPYLIEGLDANLLSLVLDYPDKTISALNWVFSIPASKIIDDFANADQAIVLPTSTVTYLKCMSEKKEEEKEKILQLV